MTDVTRILNQIEQGDPSASDQLLSLVYEELRVLARQRLANEKPGQTLQATALVHEAYLRLVGNDNDQSWDNRGDCRRHEFESRGWTIQVGVRSTIAQHRSSRASPPVWTSPSRTARAC